MRNRLFLLALLAGLAALAFFGGLHEFLAPERLRALAAEAGPWGPMVIVCLFTLLEPFGAPGFVFLLTSVSLWPFEVALAVNWAGATGAGLFGFLFARYMARDWVASRMPANLRRWDEKLSERGIGFVIGFRLVFFLNPASHWALGLSQVSLPAAVIGTLVGFAPWAAVWTYFGEEILSWLERQPIGTWVAIAAAIGGLVALRALNEQRKRRTAAATPDELDETL
jgi:uncharacterized membrane protein YdjX (TVP38/TMEM64 family)